MRFFQLEGLYGDLGPQRRYCKALIHSGDSTNIDGNSLTSRCSKGASFDIRLHWYSPLAVATTLASSIIYYSASEPISSVYEAALEKSTAPHR